MFSRRHILTIQDAGNDDRCWKLYQLQGVADVLKFRWFQYLDQNNERPGTKHATVHNALAAMAAYFQ